jgi:hypothetical protein
MLTNQLFVEIDMLKDELAKVKMQRDTLTEALLESNIQLQYLNEKYPTGTASVVITRNEQILTAVKGGQHE